MDAFCSAKAVAETSESAVPTKTKLGVYVSKYLSFGCTRRVVQGNAMVTNRILEILPCGMKWGLKET